MIPVSINDFLKSLEVPPEHYKPFPSIEEVEAFRATEFAADIECPKYRTMGDSAPVEMVGLCAEPNVALCVPVRGAYTSELKRIFRNAKAVVGHNHIQFDMPRLRDINIKVNEECKLWDTMLLQHLLFPDFPHDLEFVGSQFLSKPAWKEDKDVLETYCCRDVDVTWQCFLDLLPMVQKENLLTIYEDVQVPLAKICHLMWEHGFRVDPTNIKKVREQLLTEMEELEKELPKQLRSYNEGIHKREKAPAGTLGKSGKPVKFILVPSTKRVSPWRSTEDKKEYLYGTGHGSLGLEPILDPKKGTISTAKAALDKIFNKTQEPGVKALRKLNVLDELVTTFAKEEVGKEGPLGNRYMHPHFNVHGTSTGRLSSSDPNLQNVPLKARYMYVPSVPGWRILSVDFSSIENRLQSFFAGDTERLRRMDTPGFSEHKYLASKISGVPMELIEKSTDPDSAYSRAKHVVHGTDRGLGYIKASKMYDIPIKEARQLFDTWKAEIATTIRWQQKCGEKFKKDGVLVNPFGRKLWRLTSNGYTQALSFLPQSSGADIIYRAMIGLMYERIGLSREAALKVAPIVEPLPQPARLLLQVHDELVFEYPPELEDTLIAVVKRVMTQPWAQVGGMSFPIGIHTGNSWGECEV